MQIWVGWEVCEHLWNTCSVQVTVPSAVEIVVRGDNKDSNSKGQIVLCRALK